MEERNYKSEQIQFVVGLFKFLPENKNNLGRLGLKMRFNLNKGLGSITSFLFSKAMSILGLRLYFCSYNFVE